MTTPSCRAGDVRGPDDNDRFANDLALQPAEAADLARFLTDEFDLDQPPFIVDPHADSGGLPELGFDTVGSLIAFLEKRVAHSPKAAE
ncbi:hypothetical protein [Rhodospirillum rubrum]|uniref:Uncharacterized protein n=1 Tax=Rhodospirillum rubrum (strain ATCC 11170 / ATH 1.1.1 / DSM 467 / LMG 4362 / NCIMB 8255 / S1) TaxID=269796 RepID=Q2RTK9_RHORT|nr:hypothetical protein [Rhodospirillum rubrum]ABC22536.1 hypothetical protein Rru_A1736 [Rhodospirillum rubrum ATCC 11170]AEO48254.1 hypothetical protein F11_08940 [Rhodospirillum rubrum F11]MBK5954124.1 hypothetical protein [Rhodospirillum rubrum]QXG82164.1 hypothetical protein KUL73_08990 [Rhodospirillum rubrum]HAQ00612.1 hypothetical protein [Rhodospirillum rubrum]